MRPKRNSNIRARVFTWVLILIFVGAGWSQTRLQLLSSDKILQYAQETKRFRVRRCEIARRGSIYSSDGKILAQSTEAYELSVHFARVPKSAGFYMELGTAAQIPPSDIAQSVASGATIYMWHQLLSAENAKLVQGVKTRWKADGVSLRKVMRREYPFGEATASIIGYLQDEKPLAGLEKSYNIHLSGQNGVYEGIVDRTGAFLPTHPKKIISSTRNGQAITLTLDSYLQTAATQAIRKAVEAYQADKGVALVMQPTTGDILAMANWPSSNPCESSAFVPQVLGFNPCYMATFSPGSIFKPLTLAKSLDKGVVNPYAKINCRGELEVSKGCRIHCMWHHGHRDHGSIDAFSAIARSCNVSAATWALRVGYKDMVRFLEELGFLERTQIGLLLGGKGLFNYHDYAKNLQLANVGFGQSFTATPVALCGAFAMLANKGVQVRPRLVKAIRDKVQPVQVVGQLVKPEVAELTIRTMERVFHDEEGTGKNLVIEGYRLAGKSGTPQRVNPETGTLKGGGYIPSFIGLVPARDPKVVILVMIENPKSQEYLGAQVAGPVFREIAQSVIRYYKLPATEPVTASAKKKSS